MGELSGVSLANAQLDLATGELNIEAIDLAGVKTTVAIGKDRQLNWNGILARHAGGAEPAAAEQGAGRPAMKVKPERFGVEGMQVAVSDLSTPRPMKLDIVNGRAKLSDLGMDFDQAVALEAALDVRQGGKFSANGTVVPDKASGRLNLKLAGLSLKPFAPYVSQFARLDPQSGAASSSASRKMLEEGMPQAPATPAAPASAMP